MPITRRSAALGLSEFQDFRVDHASFISARRADLSNKKKVRVGRGPGSGLGKTAGRGIKGATSRSGYAMKVTYEGGQMPLFRRLPKRGFRNGRFKVTFVPVNVGDLSVFPRGRGSGNRGTGRAQGLAWAGRIDAR